MNTHKILPILTLTVLALGASAAAQVPAEGENVNPINLFMTREHPGEYVAGTEIEVVLNISASAEGQLTAMGLRETVPPGWVFQGMRGITGQPPAISPEVGATGDLEFAWITPPQLPYTIAYVLSIPPGEAGLRIFTGQLEYRLDGPKQVSPPVITELMGPDTTPPEITLLGENPMTVVQGRPYVEPGYTATDDVDGDVTGQVQVTGGVDTAQVGTYRLQYTAVDAAGNQTPPVERVVRVVPPPTDDDTTANQRVRNTGRYRYGTGYAYPGNTPARNTAEERERLREQQQERNRQTVAQNTAEQEAQQRNNVQRPGAKPAPAQPERVATSKEARDAQMAAKAARLPDIPKPATGEAQSDPDEAGDVSPEPSEAGEKEGETTAPVASTGPEPPAPRPETPETDAAVAETQRAAEDTRTEVAAAADTAREAARNVEREVEPPGFFARLSDAFGRMSAGQIALLVAVVVVAILLLSAAGFAWKSAYSQPRRRRQPPPAQDSR